MANKFTGITSAGVNVPVYDKEAHQALSNVYTKSEVDTELNTKQDNLSTEQLYNIDHALTTSAGLASETWVNNQGFAKESDIPTTAGLMEESKLGIDSNHITAYNGIPFSAQGGGGGGATYEGIAPIVVDNTENKISADTIDVNYQQITHDDSLVHVSNDAQYALGVNYNLTSPEYGKEKFAGYWNGSACYQILLSGAWTGTSGNFEKTVISGIPTHRFGFIDAGQSYIKRGDNSLPCTWCLGQNRYGGLLQYTMTSDIIAVRSYDSSSASFSAYVTYKYIK